MTAPALVLKTLTLAELQDHISQLDDSSRETVIRRDDIHYFSWPCTWALRGLIEDYRYIALIEPDVEEAATHYETGERLTYRVNAVVGLIELQVNPQNNAEIWLKYFEVAPRWQGQGLSKTLTRALLQLLTSPWGANRLLVRSTPSECGEVRLKGPLTQALNAQAIPWRFSGS